MTQAAAAKPATASAAVRYLRALLGAMLTLAGLAWAADVYRELGWHFLSEQFLAFVLGLALALTFIHHPWRRAAKRQALPWYDGLLAALSLAVASYTAYAYPTILTEFFTVPSDGLLCSWLLFLLVLEALRRTAGWALVLIVVSFSLYALVGHLVPGALQTREVEINRMIIYLGIDSSGLFGLVLLVGVTVVIPFIFFGQLLQASGGAGFFNDLALSLMGKFRGGAAKIAIFASSLFGSISGIVVSNIMATGVITIPLMKKSGFTARQAAAIEASASNGGQLMPPVMGAVAFVMADFLQISYRDVALAALLPSVLYYVALFLQADLEAAKLNIKPVPATLIPAIVRVLAGGWLFILPFVILIYALFWLNQEPETAALYACTCVLLVGYLLGYAGQRMSVRVIWRCIVQTGIAAIDILIIAAAAGFIMGILQLTGLGFALTLFLVQLSAGSILAVLLVSGLLCIVLGMGMPTLGVYVLLAVLVAPSLVEVGVEPLAAHMFVLYLGMMSMVTPPIAIGAFFAASIAGSEPMRTGFTAMRFSWPAYIIPFLFVFSPALLLQSRDVFTTLLSIITALAGVWLVSAGLIAYWFRPLSGWARIGALSGGLLLLTPVSLHAWGWWLNGLGMVLVGLIWGGQIAQIRAEKIHDQLNFDKKGSV